MSKDHFHFVTGRLAESMLRSVVQPLADRLSFDYTVDVLPITVAALMTPEWIAKRWTIPDRTTKVFVPGYCDRDLSALTSQTELPVEVGPKDCRDLPEFFGQDATKREKYGPYSIEIIAEINHAPRLSLPQIMDIAARYRDDGANVIDLGCDPAETWSSVADCVRRLRDEGFRVSIDSFNTSEIEKATRAGAELVLSVNSTNRDAAADWGCEVVVVPDDPQTLAGFDETIETLTKSNVAHRIDPILEPIGCGFAGSLQRYFDARKTYPEAPMMMGIGNLTELTEVDSAGVNFMLLAICEELRIHSVLTTEVINWSRTSVRECDIARRLVHYAIQQNSIPKGIDSQLVRLRDRKLHSIDTEHLEKLSSEITDHNFRVFADDQTVHLINSSFHEAGTDPFAIFAKLLAIDPKNMDASHAFYLGYEMCKALTAQTLGKQYRQDEALNWGHLTRPEVTHRNQRQTRPDKSN